MSGFTGFVDTAGRLVYRLGFEISPIILTNGIAPSILGGILPIVALTEGLNFLEGLLSGGTQALSLDQFFCHWRPIPGGSLIENQVGEYPFPSQEVAANAIISQPLNLSMQMICPVNKEGGYLAKLATIMALQYSLKQHVQQGGTFTIATPAFISTNWLLLKMSDASDGQSVQPQNTFQFDFYKPLITQAQAAQSMNSLMSKLTNGQPTDGATSGLSTVTGSTQGGAASSLLPSTSSLPAANVGGGYTDATTGYTPGTVTTTPLTP